MSRTLLPATLHTDHALTHPISLPDREISLPIKKEFGVEEMRIHISRKTVPIVPITGASAEQLVKQIIMCHKMYLVKSCQKAIPNCRIDKDKRLKLM